MLSPAEVLRIARSEVHRACRRHPYWRPLFDDLVQDACEAVYLALRTHPRAPGSWVRMWARGAVVRQARYYAGMGQRGSERPIFAPVEAAEGIRTEDPRGARDMAQFLMTKARRKHGLRGLRIVETELERDSTNRRAGLGVSVAAEFGVTRAAVSLWRKKVMADVQRWYKEAA
jgi:DNA-directed RNA polymerase specialized sigma24 family protein